MSTPADERTTGIVAFTDPPVSPAFIPALALLFFGSGATALVYQVLWTRVLGWVFGATVYAASAVWASFMAGLALGSVTAGSAADRVRRPLVWFGAAEMLVGVSAFATPAFLRWLQSVYVTVYPSLPHTLATLTFVRLAIAFVVLLAPTALMGATLPLVLKSSEFEPQHLGGHIGVLYGSNTAGAIVGTIVAGIYLIPGLGIHRTFTVAAGLNLAVGAAAMGLSSLRRVGAPAAMPGPPTRQTRWGGVPGPPARQPRWGGVPSQGQGDARRGIGDSPQPGGPAASGREAGQVGRVGPAGEGRLRLVLFVFAVSGFVSLALEVVWFRVLTLFLRPTVYGFSIMLATILGGLAIGSYIMTPLLDRPRKWIATLGLLELAIALASALSFWPLAELPVLSDRLTPTLSRVMPGYLVFPLAGSLLAIFPTALLMGLAFPIGLRLWAGADSPDAAANLEPPDSHVAARTGIFYSLNVAGAIAGALAGGFVLLPLAGSRGAIALLSAATLVSGLLLLTSAEWRGARRATTGVIAAGLLAVILFASPDPFQQFIEQRFRGDQIVWREEGVEATVVVHRSPSGDLSMTVNGNHQAGTDAVTAYVHRRIGHLAAALHSDPRTALVIGLGGGATAGAVSVHGPSVDVVELAAPVLRAAQLFASVNYDVLQRPNVRIRVDDGRNYLMLTPKRYDVVTADVIHPIYAGSGNLYSAEYFALIRRVLKPGGLVVQWAAGTDAEYKIIARTFLSVFPYTTVWGDGSLLVGTVGPLELRRSDFERKLRAAGSAQGLRDLNVESWDRLLAAYVAGPDELRAFVGSGPILTDDKPVIEYFLSLPRDRDVDTSSLKGDVRAWIRED